jgi:anti-sigma regulatory factor (Ser/Thr protein kinase)
VDGLTSTERVTALVGHELRVPLAVAFMYVGIARKYVRDARPDADVSWALSTIGHELQRLDRLLSRVIEIEERGRAVVRPSQIDLAAVVNRTVADTLAVEPQALPNVNVSLDDGGSIVGWWDDMAVEEVVRNLLSNAMRFGEGRPIRVVAERMEKGARIVVEDQGQGVAARDRARIFQRGVRAPARRGGGLGLGLWLVRELVRAHGGRVVVRSRPGGGAVFTVSLLERPPADAGRISRRPGPPARRRGQGKLGARLSAERLLVFAKHLFRAATFGELLAAARDEVRSVVGYRHVWFMVADRARAGELRLIDFSGGNRDVVWKVAPVLKVKGDRFLEDLVASDGPVVIADARMDPRTDKRIVEQLQNRTLINIPLRVLDRPLGIFGVGTFGDEGCRAPSQPELDYLVGMAAQIAVAAARIRFLEA